MQPSFDIATSSCEDNIFLAPKLKHKKKEKWKFCKNFLQVIQKVDKKKKV